MGTYRRFYAPRIIELRVCLVVNEDEYRLMRFVQQKAVDEFLRSGISKDVHAMPFHDFGERSRKRGVNLPRPNNPYRRVPTKITAFMWSALPVDKPGCTS